MTDASDDEQQSQADGAGASEIELAVRHRLEHTQDQIRRRHHND
jgi:hypothetical protein